MRLKSKLFATLLTLLVATVVFAQNGPLAPSILDYQQQVLNGGGVFQATENVQTLGNWLEITVTCNYGNSGFDPSQYSCLVGASTAPGHYKFSQVSHTYNREKNWGMDRWRLTAPVTGRRQIYAGTQFECSSGCVFNMSLVQIQGIE